MAPSRNGAGLNSGARLVRILAPPAGARPASCWFYTPLTQPDAIPAMMTP